MKRVFSIVGKILLWVLSIFLLLVGAICVSADALDPMQSEHFAWRGWSNFVWIWMSAGLLLLLLGVLVNPLVIRRRPAIVRPWWAYGLGAIACSILLLVLISFYQDATGFHDLQLGIKAETSREAIAHYERAADRGNAAGAYFAALGYDRGIMESLRGGDPADVSEPIARDPRRAVALYQIAADHGMPEAQLNLAALYFNSRDSDGNDDADLSPEKRAAHVKARDLLVLAAQSPEDNTRNAAKERLNAVCTQMVLVDEGAAADVGQDYGGCISKLAWAPKADHADNTGLGRKADVPAPPVQAAPSPAVRPSATNAAGVRADLKQPASPAPKAIAAPKSVGATALSPVTAHNEGRRSESHRSKPDTKGDCTQVQSQVGGSVSTSTNCRSADGAWTIG